MIGKRDMKRSISRKYVIQVISYIGQTDYYINAKNHLEYLIWEKKMPDPRRNVWVIKYQVITMELSHVCMSQLYC